MVINSPLSLRNFPEKHIMMNFPDLTPPTIISLELNSIIEFIKKNKIVILKPAYGNGGIGITKVSQSQRNLKSLITKYIKVFDPLWEYTKEAKREVGWKGEGYTLLQVEGDYEIYEKDGNFEVVRLPNRDGRFTGYQSLEEAQRWIHGEKEREGTGQGGRGGKKRGVKGGRVTFAELVGAGLLQDGQVLYFYNTRPFTDERAQVMVSSDKLKYERDGHTYSKSELAGLLLEKHGFKHGDYPVQGPKFWKTEASRLLDDLNEQIRIQRGERG